MGSTAIRWSEILGRTWKDDSIMKKLISLGLALCLALSLTACGGTSSGGQGGGGSQSTQVLQDGPVTLPAIFFTGMTEEEIQTSAQEQGFSQCTVNQDGSVTYTVTAEQRGQIMEATKASLDSSIADLTSGEDADKIFTKIEYNDDLSEISFYANPDTYSPNAAYAYSFCTLGAYYQIFSGTAMDAVNVTVHFINGSTNEELQTVTYQDMLAGTADTAASSSSSAAQ